MNIPGISTMLASTRIKNDVGVAVLSKSLDSMETMGDSMIKMMDNSMELSVNPNVGANFNAYV